MIIIFVLLCFITGIFIINLICKEAKLSSILIISIPIGVVFHTIVFISLSFIGLYYNKYIFIIITLLTVLSLFKKKVRIKNDLKDIPIYYLIFIGYILFRLIIMASTGFFEFYNFDEFTAYQTGSTITYLSHGFVEIYQTYAPINYFIGTMSIEFVGLSVTAARIISVIFFGLTSLFIFNALRENKVNRHISALLAMLFLISSSEMLQLAKGFYTNIFFMTYFTMGVYGIVHHFFINKEKSIPYIYFILLIGAFLTRREAMYFVILILLIISIYTLIKKLITKKQFIIMNLPILFPIIWKVMEKVHSFNYGFGSSENQGTILERIFDRLSENNLTQFLDNVSTQTIKPDYYYFNILLFIVLIITVIIVLINLFRKNKKFKEFSVLILLFEFVYIGIILFTQLVLFNIGEYLVAASFSRYIIPVIAINFIVIGCILFNNTDFKLINIIKMKKPLILKREIIKIKDPKVLLIIPAYNEEKNILKTVNSISEYNKKNKKNYDYIVINDGSHDNTENILKFNKINHIKIIHNLGIGGAVQTGYKYASENNYDVAIQFDGDGQHDINCINKLIEPIMNGEADLTIGSRFVEKNSKTFKSSALRRAGIKIISWAMKFTTNKIIYDTTSGYRACNSKIIEQFSKNYPVEYPEPISTVSILKKGYIISEIQVNMNERINGVSSIKSWKSIYYMINVFLSIIVVGIRRNK